MWPIFSEFTTLADQSSTTIVPQVGIEWKLWEPEYFPSGLTNISYVREPRPYQILELKTEKYGSQTDTLVMDNIPIKKNLESKESILARFYESAIILYQIVQFPGQPGSRDLYLACPRVEFISHGIPLPSGAKILTFEEILADPDTCEAMIYMMTEHDSEDE